MMLTRPDTADIYCRISRQTKEGDILAFAHEFNIHFNQVKPPEFVDVAMIAPKGQAIP